MKKLFLITSLVFSFGLFAQEIKVSEESQTFTTGSKNCIVVNIPYGTADIVERQLKKELKDWNGKFETSKGEFIMIQGTSKFMGEKPFDAHAKILNENGNMRVAFAIDLGGAYLSSREHAVQYKAMSERIREFARETSLKCVEEELDAASKQLSDFEKEQRSLEKDQADYVKDIEDYKKKIAEAEQKIEKNKDEQAKKKEAIKLQMEKVGEIEKKKKGIK